MKKDVFFLWFIVLVLLCVGCGSSRKAVEEDLHAERVAVVDSMVARSVVQSALASVTESEDLRIVIEEYVVKQDGSDTLISTHFDQTSETPQNYTPNLARRITIDRSTQRNAHSESQTQTSDTMHIAKADSVKVDEHKDVERETAVNAPRWGVSESLLLIFFLFVAGVIIREYINKQ